MIIRRYKNRFEAESAATALIEQGIAATVSDPPMRPLFPLEERHTGFALHILSDDDKTLAEDVLAGYAALKAEPAEFADDWEAHSQEVDLAALPAGMKIPCGQCGYNLRGLAQEGTCPECGNAYDALSLIIARHGPEALALTTDPGPADGMEITDAAAKRLRVNCPGCQYPLGNLPGRGMCPECGGRYDKLAMLRSPG